MSSKIHAAVTYLIKEGKVLLIEKGRNLGQGYLVGVGGKKEPEDKSIKETAIREVKEEIGITIKSLKEMGTIDFIFPENPKYNQIVTAFIATDWTGTPKISDEAKSISWYEITALPITQMWHDNTIWLPIVLSGKKVKGIFTIGEDNQVTDYTLED